MSGIRKLAGQTIWYGASTIGARFLNYLLTPLITYLLHNPEGVQDYGDYSLLFAWIAVANIVFLYGFETGFFRFVNKSGTDKKAIFQTTFGSIVISTVGLVALLLFFRQPISGFIGLSHNEYIIWATLIIGLDALSAIPFAKLRQDERPRKYALIKLSGIIINILFTVYFLVWLPHHFETNPDALLAGWYGRNTAVGFLLLANLFQCCFVFLLLFGEWKSFRFKINGPLWKKIFRYSSPMILIGVAAMINEVMDRQMLYLFLPLPEDAAKRIVGIYSANYKLAILISLFIQAFRMAAEPFFFDKAKDRNAQHTYARVMTWFVITMGLAFLFTALYLDIWKYFIGSAYRSGLGIVPILLGGYVCLGIYYNLSIWYKLTDKMMIGLYITLIGVAITLAGNYYFIPQYGMYASAWATSSCYFAMMVSAYLLGKKYYPVPYKVGKCLLYILITLALYFIHLGIKTFTPSLVIRLLSATVLMGVYLLIVFKMEKSEIKTLPVVGKWIK